MWRAWRQALMGAICCGLLAACDARPTIEDARREAAAGDELFKKATQAQANREAAEADTLATQAQDAMTKARDLYLSARADQSNDPKVLTEFAALCEKLRDYDLAGDAYLRAAAHSPENADSANMWYNAAKNFVSAGGRYLPRAAEPLDKAEQLVRNGATGVPIADIEATRGDISWKNGAHELAAKHYAAALEADPKSLRAKMLSACSAVALGDLTAAEKSLEELQAQGAPIGEGSAFDARLREAFAVFQKKRPIIPDTAPAYRALAGISVRLGFLIEARKAIDHTLTLDDKDVFSWNMAGSLAHQAGDIERAKEAFTRSLALEPNQPRTAQTLKDLSSTGGGQGPLN